MKSAEEGTEVKPAIGEPLVTLCTPRLAGRQVWDFEEEDGTTSAKTKDAVESGLGKQGGEAGKAGSASTAASEPPANSDHLTADELLAVIFNEMF